MEPKTTTKTTTITDSEFKLISKIGSDIISTLDIKEVIQRIYCNLNRLMDASVFAIGIFNELDNNMDIWGLDVTNQVSMLNKSLVLEEQYWLSYCFNNQEDIMINNFATKNYKYTFPTNVFNDPLNLRQSFIYIPLTINKVRLGMLTVQSFVGNAYTNKHFSIVKNLSTFVAAAIQNASNYQKIKEQNLEILKHNDRVQHARNNLEEIVRKRTFEVQEQNQRLETINKDLEMLSIVAKETENAIMIMDAEGNVLWINEYFTKIYKYTLSEFIAVRGGNILKTSFNPEIENAVRTCISEKTAIVYEALNIAIDGSEVWTQTTLTPVLNDTGEIQNLVTIDTDISKRKNAEKEALLAKDRVEKQAEVLRIANEKLERLSIVARQTENAIMIMDAEGNILWINEYFTKIYEYSFDQFNAMRGKNILQTSFNPEIEALLNKCIYTKEAVIYEALNVTVSGREIWTQTTLTPTLDDAGNIQHLVTIDTDITKRKKAERKIEKQNKNITDSIKYASRIQKAVMPNLQHLKELFNDYFVLNKPRNIVSGDFYWAKQVKIDEREVTVLAVADCTGHGVPGAFVSMLGITMLNDVISNTSCQKQYFSPEIILEELRLQIKQTLNQKGQESETKDGMDMAVCVIDKQNFSIKYAGANNPLYHMHYKNGHPEIDEYKATKNPIGVYHKEKKFELIEFKYDAGDKIYLFSDGLIDQFGGDEGRKLMSKNFKELLINTDNQKMCKQKATISQAAKDWMGDYDQIDDILVLGVRL